MIDITAVGEILIDLTQSGTEYPEDGSRIHAGKGICLVPTALDANGARYRFKGYTGHIPIEGLLNYGKFTEC